jgi:hypothetical protein
MAKRAGFIDNGVSDKTGKNPKIEDIAAKSEQAAIGKKQGLHGKNGSKGQKGRTGAEQYGENHTSPEVAGGAGGRDGEVDHLGSEDKGAEHPH